MTVSLEIYEILKQRLGDSEAKLLVNEIERIEEKTDKIIDKKIQDKSSTLASKQDVADLEVRLSRTIYITSVIQLITVIGSLIAIFKFMKS